MPRGIARRERAPAEFTSPKKRNPRVVGTRRGDQVKQERQFLCAPTSQEQITRAPSLSARKNAFVRTVFCVFPTRGLPQRENTMANLQAAYAISLPDPERQRKSGPYSVLPGSMQRSQVTDLLRETRRALNLSNAALNLLQALIDFTRPSDWIDAGTEPVCYATQTRIAAKLGCSPRQVRSHEARLVRAGLIEDRRRANGSRSKHGGSGFGLSPLIARIPELLALRDRLQSEWTRQEQLVARRSVFYRHAKAQLVELGACVGSGGELGDLAQAFLDWPPSRALRRLPLPELETHLTEAETLVDCLDALRLKTHKTSGRAEESLRSHIQDTIHETPVPCNASASQRPAGRPADAVSSGSPPSGADSGELEGEASSALRNPPWLAKLTPDRLRAIASPDMRLYLDHETRGRPAPRMMDFTLAAIAVLPALGISPSAWDDAVDQMGEVSATLCVLIIDANRSHPVTPIRRPGGALRAMTRRHAAGALNLVGSLAGLMKRREP